MDPGLAGKVVVVTGASGGIGSAIARLCAAEGARVVLHYNRGRDRAAALRRELAQAIELQADLTRPERVRRLFAQAVQRFGRVDTLIANAGSWETRDVPLHEMTVRQWRRTLDGVLTTTFLCLK